MKRELPILFTTENVKLTMEDLKTQTRRVIVPQPKIIYGLQDDIFMYYHNGEWVTIYERNSSGEWCVVERDSNLSQRRLYGRKRWKHIFENEIQRVWEQGIRGLVSPEGAYDEEGLSDNFTLPQQYKSNERCSQADLHGFPRNATEEEQSDTALERGPQRQSTRKFVLGDPIRELAGQEDSRNSISGGETLGIQIDRQRERTYKMGHRERSMQHPSCSKSFGDIPRLNPIRCPWEVGMNLYVRETWCDTDWGIEYKADMKSAESDEAMKEFGYKWKPSIHMPKKFSRTKLEVKHIGVERIQDISIEDILAEGIKKVTKDGELHKYCFYDKGDYSSIPWSEMPTDPHLAFKDLWDSINAKPRPRYRKINGVKKIVLYESYPWADIQETRFYRKTPWKVQGNPWVWKIKYKKIKAG